MAKKMYVGVSNLARNVPKAYVGVGDVARKIIKAYVGVSGVAQQFYSAGFDAYTKAMLHFNGTDASTTFTDAIGKTWTAYGNAQLDTAQKKFGTASGLFDGSGDYITTADSTDFDVGSGDFTVDCWVRRGTEGTTQSICGQYDSVGSTTSIELFIDATNKPRGQVYSSGGAFVSVSSGSTTITVDSAWHHLALVRYGNTLTLYLNGTAQGTVDATGITVRNATVQFSVGRSGEYNGQYFNGWIDEFRFSKGIARWTANFTPPTTEYTS